MSDDKPINPFKAASITPKPSPFTAPKANPFAKPSAIAEQARGVAENNKPVAKPATSIPAKPVIISKPNPFAKPAAPVHTPGVKGDIFHGSGITKKVISRVVKSIERDEKTIKQVADTAAINALNAVKRVELNTGAPKPANSIELDPSQKAALEGFLTNRYAVMIGSAGTGKTTTTKAIVREMEKTIRLIPYRLTVPDYKHDDLAQERDEDNQPLLDRPVRAIAFCAFTGRAVSMMKKALPDEYHMTAKTIHSLLGYRPVSYGKDPETGRDKMVFEPFFDRARKLPYEAVFVDEAGMLAIDLWEKLLDALRPGTRIYMIGDINQLPPVHGKSVLGFAMCEWPTFELKTIHRQAQDNPIIANAWNILSGRYPKPYGTDFVLPMMDDGSNKGQLQLLAAIQKLSKMGEFDPATDAIITATNKNSLGQTELNEKLVMFFNKDAKRTLIKTGIATVTLAVGDKIMLLQNDTSRGLTNGMIGYIREIAPNGNYKGSHHIDMEAAKDVEIDMSLINSIDDFDLKFEKEQENDKEQAKRQASHVTTVDFIIDDERVETVPFATAGDYRRMAHAYAFTCHKSQGGEYRNVVIVCHSANKMLNSREWLYTAVTRAKEKVFLIHNSRGLAKCINTQRIKGNTLEEKARVFTALSGEADKNPAINVPTLPYPAAIVHNPED